MDPRSDGQGADAGEPGDGEKDGGAPQGGADDGQAAGQSPSGSGGASASSATPGGSQATERPTTFEEIAKMAEELRNDIKKVKIKRLHDMVDLINVDVRETQVQVRCLYLKNDDAREVTSMGDVRRQLGLHEPKMVIRLMPSHFGAAYGRTFPWLSAGATGSRFPTKSIPELSDGDEEMTEHQLLLLANDVLLPLAQRTCALVIGSESCSLTAAFVQVSAPIQRELGENCPFRLLIFARAYFYHVLSTEKDTVASKVRHECRAWKEVQGTEKALEWIYGEDDAFWPREDLPAGKYSLVLFECRGTNSARLEDQIAHSFSNDFISSLSELMPVIALQTYGTNKMGMVPALAQHVSRGMPLLLLDSRDRAAESFQECKERLEEFKDKLHKGDPMTGREPRMDQYFASMLSFIKASLDKAPREDIDKDKWLWRAIEMRKKEASSLWDGRDASDEDDEHLPSCAWYCHKCGTGHKNPKLNKCRKCHVVRLGLVASPEGQAQTDHEAKDGEHLPSCVWYCHWCGTGHKNPKLNRCRKCRVARLGLVAPPEKPQTDHEAKETQTDALIRATQYVMEYVGGELEWESVQLEKRCQDGIDAVMASQSWDDLHESLRDNWVKIRSCCFHRFDTIREFAKEHSDWLTLDETKMVAVSAQGSKMLRITSSNLAAPDERLEDAKEGLNKVIQASFDESKDYDARKKSKTAFASNHDTWVAVFDILKAKNVYTGNIHRLTDLNETLSSLARLDRLPRKNQLGALMLLRAAWSIIDVFNAGANSYKMYAKLSFLFLTVATVTMVTFSAFCNIYPDSLTTRQQSTLLLVFSLFTSAVASYTALVDPYRKWVQLRTGANTLESEIWKFRTRVLDYRSNSLTPHGQKLDEVAAQDVLQQVILHVQSQVLLSTGLKETNFYSVPVTTDDRDRRSATVVQGPMASLSKVLPSGPAEAVMPPAGSKAHEAKLHKVHFKHQQHRAPSEESKGPRKDEDSWHAPASADDYIRWRLLPSMHFYQDRIPRYACLRRFYQLVVLTASLATSMLAALNEPNWTAIVAALSSAAAGWQEFSAVANKLQRYSDTAAALTGLHDWWQQLRPVDMQMVSNVSLLVEQCEAVLSGERSAWMSDAQMNLSASKGAKDARKDAAGGQGAIKPGSGGAT